MNDNEIRLLKSQNTKLKEEVVGWKAAAKREGIYGVLLGGTICLVIGLWIGVNL